MGEAPGNPFASPDGRKNIYTCRTCRGHIVTRDVEEGVTPFMIGCKATPDCKGMMNSSMYRVFDGTMAASHEWYRPEVAQVMEPGVRRHVEKGGLVLRKIRPAQEST
ncbi:hypothetical protein [Reyranella sp.]|uniref:hypothetical protein n=1 Tax=Reyranella sp. TaxID=1929291 RepID=UPI00271F1728|nr:hypothetical protein [Reyranella sp.]MDO8976752.1 hypothetical protein [Reyranella sp.]